MFFEKVYVVGSGSICINIIKSLINKNIKPIALVYREHKLSSLSIFLAAGKVAYEAFLDKESMIRYLEGIRDRALIISANNVFLFPKSIVSKNNLKIVNFHNALLPAHRGMNAPTWEIYEQDAVAGITWHIVNENIDDGDIIIQKSIVLDNRETAMNLIKELMNLAFDAYCQIEDDLLNWTIKTTPMPKIENRQIHYAKDVPNDGRLDLSWPLPKISAFLRALDWGCVKQFPLPIVALNSRFLTVEKYKISEDFRIELYTDAGVILIDDSGYDISAVSD